jgi:O-antigen ligase/polysaccharide polymerase Wzy-like membrane protein
MNRVAAHSFPAIVGRTRAKNSDKATDQLWAYRGIAFCLLHIPLALLLSRSTVVSTLHAVAVAGVGVWWAISAERNPIRVAYVGAYIVGAEVLWRMTGALVFWEFGKYAISAIFLIAILRSGRMKGPALMLIYFALLIPSIAVIIFRVGAEAKGYISFNLSGPLALTVAAWYFSRCKVTVEDVKRIFLAAVGPIIGIASITFFAVYSARKLSFTSESNFVSSGGFGPNQVSAALGLGALLALMFVLLGKTNYKLKLLMLGSMFLMAAQSALTFSRGGLYNFAGAIAFSSVYLLRNVRTRRTLLFVAIMIFVMGSFVILPRLENVTGGALESRFTNTDPTNRVEIIKDELKVWRRYPILGVGPGGSKFVGASTAHTEFARLPAEHGILGVVALLLLLVVAAKNIRKANSVEGKAIAVCLIGWSFLFMLNAAMRLAAPAFAFGLAFATVVPESGLNSKSLGLALRVMTARLRQKRQLRFQQIVATGKTLKDSSKSQSSYTA